MITTRRLYPNVPIIPSDLFVASDHLAKTISLRYKPNNCLYDLDDVSIRNFPQVTITRQSTTNPPVRGAFDISWGNNSFNGIF